MAHNLHLGGENNRSALLMNILYELEFDLDGFLDSMEQQKSARRRIEEHMELRRLRDELGYADDFELEERRK